MSDWYKIDLGDAMMAAMALDEIAIQLTDIYNKNSKPENMVAIYRHESLGLHCSLMVYLTETFQVIAQYSDATKINYIPELDSGFLAGNKAKLD
ncbi:hypothetical protein [Reinekea sp.]|jgi:hypothetical protein|uniref:hypothetical protein n=1 Tax=Reinekea sp. TaxID=1970455 RepID=UPI003989E386